MRSRAVCRATGGRRARSERGRRARRAGRQRSVPRRSRLRSLLRRCRRSSEEPSGRHGRTRSTNATPRRPSASAPAQHEPRPEPAVLPSAGAGSGLRNASGHGAGGDQPRGCPHRAPGTGPCRGRTATPCRAVPARPRPRPRASRWFRSKRDRRRRGRTSRQASGLHLRPGSRRCGPRRRAGTLPSSSLRRWCEEASARCFHQIQDQFEALVGSVVGIGTS